MVQPSSNIIQETQVIVLATGDTPSAISNARGHLFEVFIARVLQRLGYNEPRFENVNVSSDGIELDVVAEHKLTRQTVIAECKAYSSPVKAKELVAFYGKLHAERLMSSNATLGGFFFALPRTTQQGAEKANAISAKDSHFRYLDSEAVAEIVQSAGMVPRSIEMNPREVFSDAAIVITEFGTYSAVKRLDEITRTTAEVLVWSVVGNVPEPALELIGNSEYCSGVRVRDGRAIISSSGYSSGQENANPLTLEVKGSGSDFEYQLPASPQYFVGRRKLVAQVEEIILSGPSVLVANAQSGWGKSSLALRIKQSTQKLGGSCIVFDTRTAANKDYVAAALRKAAMQAEQEGIIRLPADSSWASLPSALETLKSSDWNSSTSPVLVFFDQFENVFKNETLTREFRDLALGVQELEHPFSVGFAWKTDLVGWIEGHPYRLRDEIRSQANVIQLSPFGPGEVDTLLRKLEKSLDAKLVRDLKERLREYSQGYPWLFKKLAGHVLREVKDGVSQSQLVSETLNVQSLFERDLAELTLREREGLSQIARFAPMAASDATELVPSGVVQSLLDRRLLIQLGERIDTYWDIFRDFLVNGSIPIEDSFILRISPTSVGRLLREVTERGGDVAVADLANALGTTEAVVYNNSRDLRHFGLLVYEPTRIRVTSEYLNSENKETYLRQRVATALRRHRAHSMLTRLLEQHGGAVPLSTFGRSLPNAFPAVAAGEKSWALYAGSFSQWFQYAGVAVLENQSIRLATEDSPSREVNLLSLSRYRNIGRTQSAFPRKSPGLSLKTMQDIWRGSRVKAGGKTSAARATGDLVLLGIAEVKDGFLVLTNAAPLDSHGNLNPRKLLELLKTQPGLSEGMETLAQDPRTPHEVLGEFVRLAHSANWAPGTIALVGKQVRGWAKSAGVIDRTVRSVAVGQYPEPASGNFSAPTSFSQESLLPD